MKGRDGSNPRLSATQSAIFALSAENSKILRIFEHFVGLKGTREYQIPPSAAHFGSILSVEDRAGALRPISALTRPRFLCCDFAGRIRLPIAMTAWTVDPRQ